MVVFLKIQLGKAFLWRDGVCGVVEYNGKRNQRCSETGKTRRTGFAENQNFCVVILSLRYTCLGSEILHLIQDLTISLGSFLCTP